jgi:hypothetical protein
MPKLNLLSLEALHGNFSFTPSQKAANIIAKRNNNEILFNPSITYKNNLSECFRIFTDPIRSSNLPASHNFTHQFNIQWLKKLSQCLATLERLACHKSNKIDNNLNIIYTILYHLGF